MHTRDCRLPSKEHERLMKDNWVLKWAVRRSCSPPLTLNHLQHHIHDVLVTGSSALRAEDTGQEEALAAKTNHPATLWFSASSNIFWQG